MDPLLIAVCVLTCLILVLQLTLLLRKPTDRGDQLVAIREQLDGIRDSTQKLHEIGPAIGDAREASRRAGGEVAEMRGRLTGFETAQVKAAETINGLRTSLPLELQTGISALADALRNALARQVVPELAAGKAAITEGLNLVKTSASEHRQESGNAAAALRSEMSTILKVQAESTSRLALSMDARFVELSVSNGDAIRQIQKSVEGQLQQQREEAAQHRNELTLATTAMRAEVSGALRSSAESVEKKVSELRGATEGKLAEIVTRSAEGAKALNDTAQQTITIVAAQLNELKTTMDSALKAELGALRSENSAKLEEMRRTVDEKLHATLEQRLGESFKLVSDRLELVHRGLGEMQTLAAGVGDLKKVLTNVKTRGTWGEVQLDALLDQILTAEQYGKNVATKPGSAARVEFAIRLPGRDESGAPVWLPIDAKFPMEDYQRLVEAQERADLPAIEDAGKALESRIKLEARAIRDKYVDPPHTTDFAILYLPTEGLYAEVLRRPGLADNLQRDCKINVAGPTTLAAMLNSLQMGFRTLAIEKRSSEVWTVLGAVKTEFGKFGDALAHTKKKLEEASNSINNAEQRSRVLTKKLDKVEAMAAPEATLLLDGPAVVGLAVALVDGH